MTTPPQTPIQATNALAVIIDNMVVDIFKVDNRLAAMLLSEPVFVDVTEPHNAGRLTSGYTYEPSTGEFTPPVVEHNHTHLPVEPAPGE
jgi:hypothetical protein